MLFEHLVSLSLDTKINNIVSIALATYRPLLVVDCLKYIATLLEGKIPSKNFVFNSLLPFLTYFPNSSH